MIKAAIFDMDGVILDTERIYDEGWKLACQQLCYDMPESVRLSFVGLNTENSRRRLREFSDAMDFDALMSIVYAHLHGRIDRREIPVKSGLFELLDYLRATGRRIALATSTARPLAMAQLDTADLMKWFDETAFGDEVSHGKPAPDVYALAVKRLGLSPDECIALEDSPAGIRSAFDAGVRPVMVPDRIQPTAELAPMLYAVRSDLSQIIPLLEEAQPPLSV